MTHEINDLKKNCAIFALNSGKKRKKFYPKLIK